MILKYLSFLWKAHIVLMLADKNGSTSYISFQKTHVKIQNESINNGTKYNLG